MIQLYHKSYKNTIGGNKMFTKKNVLILGIIAFAGFYLGALAVRAVINTMIGGTLFGGNLL